jgi:leucyl aminopeptidase
MTTPPEISFCETDLDAIGNATGRVAVFIGAEGKMDPSGRRVNRLTRGALARFVQSERFTKLKPGEAKALAFPAGMAAEAVDVVRLDRRPTVEEARKAGAALAKLQNGAESLILAGSNPRAAEISLGFALRAYTFDAHKTGASWSASQRPWPRPPRRWRRWPRACSLPAI